MSIIKIEKVNPVVDANEFKTLAGLCSQIEQLVLNVVEHKDSFRVEVVVEQENKNLFLDFFSTCSTNTIKYLINTFGKQMDDYNIMVISKDSLFNFQLVGDRLPKTLDFKLQGLSVTDLLQVLKDNGIEQQPKPGLFENCLNALCAYQDKSLGRNFTKQTTLEVISVKTI